MDTPRKKKDEALMWELRKGQIDNAAILFERYYIKLYNFFLRLTQDSTVSEDLTQTVFERIIRYKKSYKKDMPFKAWFFQIARNVKTDYYKKKQVYNNDYSKIEQSSTTEINAQERLQNQEQQDQLQRALNQLKLEQKELLLLAHYQKLKYKEIAAIYGYSETAVKVKIHRAIKQLRNHFLKLDKG